MNFNSPKRAKSKLDIGFLGFRWHKHSQSPLRTFTAVYISRLWGAAIKWVVSRAPSCIKAAEIAANYDVATHRCLSRYFGCASFSSIPDCRDVIADGRNRENSVWLPQVIAQKQEEQRKRYHLNIIYKLSPLDKTRLRLLQYLNYFY